MEVKRPGHVYGPVASRRYGPSLGVDVIPPKTCSYDCVYCQQGRTTDLSIERRDFFPPEEILADVREALTRGPAPAVVTLAGSGEPTLCSSLGRVIEGIKAMTSIPVVLLTNGSHLSDPGVRRDAALADILVPSLDAGDPVTFERVNRPHPGISFEEMFEGLRAMRGQARGRFHVEVLLARGFNDGAESVAHIAARLSALDPDLVEVNTAVRPVPGGSRLALERDSIDRIVAALGPKAQLVASLPVTLACEGTSRGSDILAVLERRPCTAADLASALGLNPAEVVSRIEDLIRAGTVETAGDGLHYHAASHVRRHHP